MRRLALVLGVICFSLSPLMPQGKKVPVAQLESRFREFLKVTQYIMLDKERDVFMQLTLDRDRDIFIDAFWKQRDPTPGTPLNEFKEEHMARFEYANKQFRRGSGREGWMTDRGRIYIILGEPSSIERLDTEYGVYPCEIWSYYGDTAKNLPIGFSLVFFQKGSVGEYRLYSPVSDGPASLLIEGKSMDPFDYEALFDKIKQYSASLAMVCLSMIPGEMPANFQPSTRDAIIMADILDSPKKAINPVYATHFLDYKGIVSTEYLTNYFDNQTELCLIKDPVLGLNFMHFSMAPKSLTVDYYPPNDQNYITFKVDVSLRQKENIIFQYSKDFPFYFPASDLNRVKGNGVAIEDSFPVIEGQYKMIILLQNPLGKEFSVFEKDIDIPRETAGPHLIGPFLGYKFQDYRQDIHIPFKVLDKKLVVDPSNTFSPSDNICLFFLVSQATPSLWEKGTVKIQIKGLRPQNPAEKSFSLNLAENLFRQTLVVIHSLSAQDLPADYYEMTLSLFNENGTLVDTGKANFIVSPAANTPHPIALAKGFPHANSFLYLYMLAHQYESVNDYENAEKTYAQGAEMNPGYTKGLLDYANFLVKAKNYEKGLTWAERAKDDEKLKFEYNIIKGKAQMGLGKYGEAVESLLAANKIYNSDPSVLYTLGLCYYRFGQKENALEVLKAALALNPKQQEVQKLIAEIEKK
jgi:GWxTD domain-containing protein